jgi:hypothetical protein
MLFKSFRLIPGRKWFSFARAILFLNRDRALHSFARSFLSPALHSIYLSQTTSDLNEDSDTQVTVDLVPHHTCNTRAPHWYKRPEQAQLPSPIGSAWLNKEPARPRSVANGFPTHPRS